jgi:hypothetical protein
MSKLFRCIDCGKEFIFDYSQSDISLTYSDYEKDQKTINDYIKGLNFPTETNICYECLDCIQTYDNPALIKKQTQIKQCPQEEYIDELKEKYKKEEEDLKIFTMVKEKKQMKELDDIKKKVGKSEEELNSLLKELEAVEKEETEFCNEFRDLETKLYFVEKEITQSSDVKQDYENKIEILNNNDIFSGLFHISFNEKYGSINGCKFTEPYVSNNYDTINAGWGYIIFLTKLLAIRYSFESTKYELIPEGNFSKINNKDTNIEYEIGISDMNRTKDKFNRAMLAYLEYLNEFLNYLINEKKIKNASADVFPKIKDKKINGKCIQIGSGKETLEDWYLCMKYLLTILQYLICQVLSSENKAYKEKVDDNEQDNNNSGNTIDEKK